MTTPTYNLKDHTHIQPQQFDHTHIQPQQFDHTHRMVLYPVHIDHTNSNLSNLSLRVKNFYTKPLTTPTAVTNGHCPGLNRKDKKEEEQSKAPKKKKHEGQRRCPASHKMTSRQQDHLSLSLNKQLSYTNPEASWLA